MVRLTADVLANAPSFLNPLKQRELDLRGYKIPAIENLGITRDQNEAIGKYNSDHCRFPLKRLIAETGIIDFTDNDIRHLGNFPRFTHLKTLLCARNRISSISPSLASTLPNLEVLVLSSNALTELTDLDAIAEFKSLDTLTCLDNPVSRNPHYRAWLIWRCPGLRVLDFRKIKTAERTAATELFGTSDDPTPLAADLLGIKSKTFDVSSTNGSDGPGLGRITEDERRKIKLAIMDATTMAEVQKLEMMLLEGRIPEGTKL
ncbi:Small nuclear ribonucleoprotein U2, A' [Taphrina deformans PYCC 5710]|uniref:U2 small nuclear ribonucleoprotein A' n=1 Tax=Taphrina deformans (strain PYCC 5710 / ATCC 11124 / CBS 356.35 / IMI 108563 / JCM 9778 / NBRC 8474) TaxID=1097556 RepID=R4X807_TAPDE|nr:Small nuclear ribonucleoprotein U2, A' [Taphrina deformans PYCC 5710]|eukprot:CCG81620.1 Small nuclear ribonucleoprotein U2, A' [Taphrina deformans PYCC 5710]